MAEPVIWSEADRRHMAHALTLARRGLGRVWPNPAVGCVLVSADGRIVGRGWTQPGGRPHGEAMALAAAGEAARGATAYVSLEPCAHWGKTPPCADALVAAGVARAVVATGDPDPRVSGRGLDRMTAAGVTVDLGLMAAEAGALNAGFFSRILKGRPLVAWKVATTLDGRIATVAGESQWITGPEARAMGHMLRASHDAIGRAALTVDLSQTSLIGKVGKASASVETAAGRAAEEEEAAAASYAASKVDDEATKALSVLQAEEDASAAWGINA